MVGLNLPLFFAMVNVPLDRFSSVAQCEAFLTVNALSSSCIVFCMDFSG